jgi:hypothetical protein
MALKVFSGLVKVMGIQRPTIVAATTQKRASELLGVSIRIMCDYWEVSEDPTEIAMATAQPETVFRSSKILAKDFQPVVSPINTNSTFYSDGWMDARQGKPASVPSGVHGNEYMAGFTAAGMAADEQLNQAIQ